MKKQLSKTICLGFLSILILGTFVSAAPTNTPEIESVDSWPGDISHGEEVYVDAEISNQASVEDVWIVVESEGERIKSGTMADSNNDGYYVSPVAFEADGGQQYEIVVKAADKNGNQISEEAKVYADCKFGIIGKCLH